jgi:hypothetical protein
MQKVQNRRVPGFTAENALQHGATKYAGAARSTPQGVLPAARACFPVPACKCEPGIEGTCDCTVRMHCI